MFKQIVCVVLIVSGLAVSLVGCGSETSGSISLSTSSTASGVVKAEATYTPESGSALQDQNITFYWYTVGQNSKIRTDYPSNDASTNSFGKAISELTLPFPRTEIVTVYVKANTGGLTSGFQSVNVIK